MYYIQHRCDFYKAHAIQTRNLDDYAHDEFFHTLETLNLDWNIQYHLKDVYYNKENKIWSQEKKVDI